MNLTLPAELGGEAGVERALPDFGQRPLGGRGELEVPFRLTDAGDLADCHQ